MVCMFVFLFLRFEKATFEKATEVYHKHREGLSLTLCKTHRDFGQPEIYLLMGSVRWERASVNFKSIVLDSHPEQNQVMRKD